MGERVEADGTREPTGRGLLHSLRVPFGRGVVEIGFGRAAGDLVGSLLSVILHIPDQGWARTGGHIAPSAGSGQAVGVAGVVCPQTAPRPPLTRGAGFCTMKAMDQRHDKHDEELLQYHRAAGLALTPVMQQLGYATEVEVDISMKSQLIDIISVRREKIVQPTLPPIYWEVFEPLNEHNLFSFKSTANRSTATRSKSSMATSPTTVR